MGIVDRLSPSSIGWLEYCDFPVEGVLPGLEPAPRPMVDEEIRDYLQPETANETGGGNGGVVDMVLEELVGQSDLLQNSLQTQESVPLVRDPETQL